MSPAAEVADFSTAARIVTARGRHQIHMIGRFIKVRSSSRTVHCTTWCDGLDVGSWLTARCFRQIMLGMRIARGSTRATIVRMRRNVSRLLGVQMLEEPLKTARFLQLDPTSGWNARCRKSFLYQEIRVEIAPPSRACTYCSDFAVSCSVTDLLFTSLTGIKIATNNCGFTRSGRNRSFFQSGQLLQQTCSNARFSDQTATSSGQSIE